MLICIHSSAEASLRFLLAAAKPMKEKFKGRLEVILITSPELEQLLRDIGADFVTSDIQSMVKWAEQEFKKFPS
jgi:hypothetical protein